MISVGLICYVQVTASEAEPEWVGELVWPPQPHNLSPAPRRQRWMRLLSAGQGVTTKVVAPRERGAAALCGPFRHVAESLEKVGYSDATLCCAIHDWRLSPPSLERQGFFTWLLQRLEQMREDQGQPCVLVAHSSGGLVARHLLAFAAREKGAAWLEHHVAKFLAIGVHRIPNTATHLTTI